MVTTAIVEKAVIRTLQINLFQGDRIMKDMSNVPAYGLWWLVIINSLIFIIFAFSFTKPRTPRDWRSFGAFSAFIVALFAEMYGFPLTLYLLSGWLQTRYPGLNIFSHDAGHLWWTLLGWKGDPHLNPIHLLSSVLVFGGLIYLGSAWEVLYKAQRSHTLAVSGPYATIRHPQYVGFIVIILGFLLQWPTLLTLLMFPILVTMYIRLAHQEERDALAEFGDEYARYAAVTPAFLPWGRRNTQRKLSHAQESHHDP
ncbi:methyltransferase family protein [Nostoc sp.]|uniref:methyltransferase family protein n=1 Tax=Nostoc sp. TaxID=1180 RepID=UPI002FFC1F17